MLFGEWWGSLTGAQQIFWTISIVFSVFFLIQFVLSLIGLDFDTDTDVDIDVSTDGHDFSLSTDFTLFSVRSIIAFFTFFGWTGVLVLNNGGNVWLALTASFISGFAAMFLVGYMMFLFSKLTKEGNIDINMARSSIGEVYLPVPANKNGYGKVFVQIQGALQELDAVTDGDALPTGSRIRVVEILNDNVLLVEPAEQLLDEV